VDTNGWSNLRLQSNSPCINAGHNAYVTANTDLDGLPRIAGGTVDIGAYEFQSPASTISYAWLQQSGLPTDGSADDVDADHDGHKNWQEWMAGTNPTNALSVLRLASPVITPTNVTLTWTSVTNRTYTLEQASRANPLHRDSGYRQSEEWQTRCAWACSAAPSGAISRRRSSPFSSPAGRGLVLSQRDKTQLPKCSQVS